MKRSQTRKEQRRLVSRLCFLDAGHRDRFSLPSHDYVVKSRYRMSIKDLSQLEKMLHKINFVCSISSFELLILALLLVPFHGYTSFLNAILFPCVPSW